MGDGISAVSIPLAYGLVAQALIAAAAVRLAFEALMRAQVGAPKPAAPHQRNQRAGRSAWTTDRSRQDVPRGTAWAMAAGPLVLLVPLGGCTLAEHMRGIWGDPSIITCALLALFVARPDRLPARPSRIICIAITALVTLPLYGPIMGLALPLPDLYGYGWQPLTLLVAIAAASILMWALRSWSIGWSVMLALSLLAYALRTMESSNLMDYLVDPGLLLTLAVMVILPHRHSAPTAPGRAADE